MPSLKSIRTRIGSVKNTQKITKAMKLVAAARLRRATQRILELRPYAAKVDTVLQSVVAAAPSGVDEAIGQHPLLQPHDAVNTVWLLVVSSDRGLAGAYNANVQRAGDRRLRELTEEGVANVKLVTIGRKGREYFQRKGVEVVHDFHGVQEGGARRIAEIARTLTEAFVAGEVDRIEVIYTEFKSAISQTVKTETLLPFTAPESAGDAGASLTDFIFEPDRTSLLERLVPMAVEVKVFRAVLESAASEHGARMTAMDNATRNASDMIDSLTLQYNRARQAYITKELMEIIGGAEALKG